jgi:glycosyltransferase involved in cell wall biosynthesis
MSQPPRNILHIIDTLAPGGAERMAIEIANATDRERYKAGICVTRSRADLSTSIHAHVGLLILGREQRFDFARFSHLANFCEKQKIQLLHIHGWASYNFIVFLSLYQPAIGNCSWVLHDHYGDVEIDPNLPLSIKLGLWLRKPYYVSVHPKLAELAAESGLAKQKIATIPNAIDFSPYKIHSNQDPFIPFRDKQSCRMGVVIANVRRSKDIELLLQGLAKVQATNWKVIVLGGLVEPNYVQVCMDLRQRLGLQDRVFFPGAQLNVQSFLGKADFAILTSKTESGPLALIEYAAAGLPFVSTRVGLIGNFLANHNLPGFIPLGDDQSLASAVDDLLALSDAQLKERGRRIRRVAERYFDIHTVMPQWYDVYERALQKAKE